MIRRRTKPPLRNSERGVTMILVVLSMLSMLAIVALAIDVITLYAAHSETQRVADASALAAAKALVDSGVTADPANVALQATAQATAIQVGKDVGKQLAIAGRQVQGADVTVTFPNGGAASFGNNPIVNVSVVNAFLPTFFSKIFNRTSLTVQASATAEAFNPSSSSIPVVSRCVKPFIIPNCDPAHAGGVCGAAATFIDPTTGAITFPGQTPAGVIGETFTLRSNCTGPGCVPGPPAAGRYYPADINIPLTGNSCPAGCVGATNFEQNVECCNPTALTCGAALAPVQPLPLDATVFPEGAGGPAESGLQCLIHQNPGNGQDIINDHLLGTPLNYPLRIQVGGNHPLQGGGVAVNDYITTSDSMVTLPIYDGAATPGASVTVIGFLQVFIDQEYSGTGNPLTPDGSMQVTVVNVAGCGSAATGTAVASGGTSAIPVRLIHQ